MTLRADLQSLADETDFSGVISASSGGSDTIELARGFACRARELPIAMDTRFGIASGTKGLTALTVASLIESRELALSTTVKSLLQDRLPDIDDTVTIEHLLGHTSGIGDYLDESEMGDIENYTLGIPAHRLESPRDYLPLLAGRPQKTAPGAVFAYNNSGFVVLSLAIEAACGKSFFAAVRERVLNPADMRDTDFFRSDDLPARVATGYLKNGRSNVFHLPVRGAGDGGAYSTIHDIERMWAALFAGDIVPMEMVDRLIAPRNVSSGGEWHYGLGFWLKPGSGGVMLEGCDAGVSFRSWYEPSSRNRYTVISNTSDGAWPITRYLDERFGA